LQLPRIPKTDERVLAFEGENSHGNKIPTGMKTFVEVETFVEVATRSSRGA
jgi:hypothetical protein